jgi:uncharacterized integral membrane protein
MKNPMKQLKVLAIALLALVTLVVVLQNTDPFPIKILFFDPITAPAAVLLFAAGVIGFVLGMATSLFLGRGKRAPSPGGDPPDA